MSLYDFFFPEQAQATHLRNIASSQRIRGASNRGRTHALKKRIDDLEDDMGYIALLLGSLLERLDDKGVVTRDDLKASIEKIDELDKVKDGKLDINILRLISP